RLHRAHARHHRHGSVGVRAALPVIAMAVGAVAFVLAVVLRGGAGDVLSVLGLVLIGVGESPRVC
ncbi:hypothetical protein L2D97_25570, partial [Salmonella enterica subsp. enterica serovar Weltevreden]|uniref:hypothetical protein n=1 Tax=Salmonella enterica TaxID=28901 RepID=UPI001F396FFD